jgi:hypothetical protein
VIDEKQQKQQIQGQPEAKEENAAQTHVRSSGFFISFAAAGILVPVMIVILGLAMADHSAIGHLDDKMEYLNSRVVDGTVVARLVDHDANIIDRLKGIDERLHNLEVFASSSTQDRAAIHFELNAWREWLRYQGKDPPRGIGNPNDHPSGERQ